ncbi:MAG: hypothetical protein H6Q69_2730 [Firmicutes bacterium]|nr:hypothetical protein [Bacillota bacterium]
MARSNRKRREWRRLDRIMKVVDLEIEKQLICAEENLCVSGLYGRRQKEPTAQKALNNIERQNKAAK